MRQQGAMKTSITWSPGAGLNVVGVERRERAWTVTVDSRQPTFCPGCGAQSKSRHSTYWRRLWDLSAQGAPVIVKARLGRWRCRNQQCDRRIFTERVPSLAAPFARRYASMGRMTERLNSMVEAVDPAKADDAVVGKRFAPRVNQTQPRWLPTAARRTGLV